MRWIQSIRASSATELAVPQRGRKLASLKHSAASVRHRARRINEEFSGTHVRRRSDARRPEGRAGRLRVIGLSHEGERRSRQRRMSDWARPDDATHAETFGDAASRRLTIFHLVDWHLVVIATIVRRRHQFRSRGRCRRRSDTAADRQHRHREGENENKYRPANAHDSCLGANIRPAGPMVK
jgi:hypothetical protein